MTLTFSQDGKGNITILRQADGWSTTMTVDNFKKIVSSYLIYYGEGKSDYLVNLSVVATYNNYSSGSPPVGFGKDDGKYYVYRNELYQYATEKGLLKITDAPKTAADIDRETFQKAVDTEMRKLPRQTLMDGLNAWQEFDKFLSDSSITETSTKRALITMIQPVCAKNPMCEVVRRTAFSFGVREMEESCKHCAFYDSICAKGAQKNIFTLIQNLMNTAPTDLQVSAMKNDILSSVGERNQICLDYIDKLYGSN